MAPGRDRADLRAAYRHQGLDVAAEPAEERLADFDRRKDLEPAAADGEGGPMDRGLAVADIGSARRQLGIVEDEAEDVLQAEASEKAAQDDEVEREQRPLAETLRSLFENYQDKADEEVGEGEEVQVPKALRLPSVVIIDEPSEGLSGNLEENEPAPGAVLYNSGETSPQRATERLLAAHPEARLDPDSGVLNLPALPSSIASSTSLADLGERIGKATGVTRVSVSSVTEDDVVLDVELNPGTTATRVRRGSCREERVKHFVSTTTAYQRTNFDEEWMLPKEDAPRGERYRFRRSNKDGEPYRDISKKPFTVQDYVSELEGTRMASGKVVKFPARVRDLDNRNGDIAKLVGHYAYVVVGDVSLTTVYDEQWDGKKLPELSNDMRDELWRVLERATFTIDDSPPHYYIRLDASTQQAMSDAWDKVIKADGGAHPELAAGKAAWLALLTKEEYHHAWPKWLGGHPEQRRLYLPRALHNFAAVNIGTGGFHQVLNQKLLNEEWFTGELAKEMGVGINCTQEAFKTFLGHKNVKPWEVNARLDVILRETYSEVLRAATGGNNEVAYKAYCAELENEINPHVERP